MIQYFCNQGTEDVFEGRITGMAQRICPRTLWKVAARKLDQLDSAAALSELGIRSREPLEGVARDRPGPHRIQIHAGYYLLFTWGAAGPEQVEIVELSE